LNVALVGIAGPSGSGKTSLAQALVDHFGPESTTLVPLDAYYRDLSDLEPRLRRLRNFDSPESLDEKLMIRQLGGLEQGRSVELPVYRFDTHSRAPRGALVAPAGTVVVEGLFALYWARVRDLLKLKVFVDVDDGVALSRRIERDVRDRGRSPETVLRQYEQTVRPMYERYVLPTKDHADLVLDGTRPIDDLVSELRARWPVRAVRG
jgi:uridine kinase